ncbi:hypothetical protein [Bacillus mojavensis]
MKAITVTKRVKGQLDKLIQEKREDYPISTVSSLSIDVACDLYDGKSVVEGITVDEAVKCLLVGYRSETNEEIFLNKIKEREDYLEELIEYRKAKGHISMAKNYAAELYGLQLVRDCFKEVYSINE